MFYLLLFLVGQVFCELRVEDLRGWDYVNLHCRDNDNVPVDWWILYKPPSSNLPWQAGLNFSYISSVEAGKWIPSNRIITGNSMLMNTLAPMFRPAYQNHLAVSSYYPKPGSNEQAGSAASGLLMADELSGMWIPHTVPGFPDQTRGHFYFPKNELKNGHIIMCLSADFITLNELALRLREMEPLVMGVRLPDSMKPWLPDWLPVTTRQPDHTPLNAKFLPKTFGYVTNNKSLRAEVTVRRPGDTRCLYQIFAMTRSIILDVYGHHKHKPAICQKYYSIRNIDAISLNYPNHINDNVEHAHVVYVNNRTDRLEFGVSTAHWQHAGGIVKPEYWACIGSSGADDASGKGSLLLCIEDYHVWRSFDILKIKEPEC